MFLNVSFLKGCLQKKCCVFLLSDGLYHTVIQVSVQWCTVTVKLMMKC